jgi:hypothetical protein
MGSNNALPRLGAQKVQPETREINLPETGGSILIRKPGIGTVERALAHVSGGDLEKAPPVEHLRFVLTLLEGMLVEPRLSPEQMRDQLLGADWEILMEKIPEFAGVGEKEQREASASFPDEGKRAAVQVPVGKGSGASDRGADGGGDVGG